MRVLSVRDGSEAEDIESGRAILSMTIGHPSITAMVVRGLSPEIRRFADKAASRADPFPWREVVWMTDDRLFQADQDAWFRDHPAACAVVLDIRDQPVVWLGPSAHVFDIDDAFLTAEGH